MKNPNLLLLSSSRVKDTAYLEHALEMIKDHLGEINELLFIPYAGITVNYDDYTKMVQSALVTLNIKVIGIHQTDDPVAAIQSAQAIVIGGGNTFHLLHQLYENNLLEVIQQRVNSGTPYIGWSAGSNVAGSSIRTTNDMPIIEPPSFNALALVPFQINPHYTNYIAPGHNGETRAQRLMEFTCIEPTMPIICIQEGTALLRKDDKLTLLGEKEAFLFHGEQYEVALCADSDLSPYLLS